MKTKKLITLIIVTTMLLLMSCVQPVLKTNEFKVVDTLSVNRNGFNSILSYSVIIKYDSSFYYGSISPKGELTYMNVRKIKTEKLK